MSTKGIKVHKRSYSIVNGPNKDVLFDACKYAFSKTATIAIDFRVVTGYTMPRNHPGCAYTMMNIDEMKIHGIEYADEVSGNLNLHGHCKAALGHSSESTKHYKFEALYNSRTREGVITFLE